MSDAGEEGEKAEKKRKRRKTPLQAAVAALTEISEELVCPITQELTVDPVIAQDDRLYDRPAIEKWVRENGTSPLTRQPMHMHFRPAPHVTQLISSLVKSGSLPKEITIAWEKKQERRAFLSAITTKAEAGDRCSCRFLGDLYAHGDAKPLEGEDFPVPASVLESSFDVDRALSLRSYERGMFKGDMYCVEGVAKHLLREGPSGAWNVKAIGLLHQCGPWRPSAAMVLGLLYASGKVEQNGDQTSARYWLERVTRSSWADHERVIRDIAAAYLKKADEEGWGAASDWEGRMRHRVDMWRGSRS